MPGTTATCTCWSPFTGSAKRLTTGTRTSTGTSAITSRTTAASSFWRWRSAASRPSIAARNIAPSRPLLRHHGMVITGVRAMRSSTAALSGASTTPVSSDRAAFTPSPCSTTDCRPRLYTLMVTPMVSGTPRLPACSAGSSRRGAVASTATPAASVSASDVRCSVSVSASQSAGSANVPRGAPESRGTRVRIHQARAPAGLLGEQLRGARAEQVTCTAHERQAARERGHHRFRRRRVEERARLGEGTAGGVEQRGHARAAALHTQRRPRGVDPIEERAFGVGVRRCGDSGLHRLAREVVELRTAPLERAEALRLVLTAALRRDLVVAAPEERRVLAHIHAPRRRIGREAGGAIELGHGPRQAVRGDRERDRVGGLRPTLRARAARRPGDGRARRAACR